MDSFTKWFTETFVDENGTFIEFCMFCVLRGNTRQRISFSKIQALFPEKKDPRYLNNDTAISERFLYQMTEQLLLAGIHPRELVSHPKNQQLEYSPSKGLMFNFANRCHNYNARVFLEIVSEILSGRTS